jgi:predicted nucleotidyltransferase
VLFGSRASGAARPSSEFDLALWPAGPVATPTQLRWLRELEELLGHDVSLVLVGSDLDPVLGFEIVRGGHLLFEAEPGLWATLRARLWHAHEDSLPFRRAAEQRLHEFARELAGEARARERREA